MPLIVGSLGTQRFGRPLQMAAGRSAAYFDNAPFYGACQTSAEILQQLRYALGYMEVPPALAPLLTGYRELSANLDFQLPHDLIFVEITGRRVLSLDGIVLQVGAVGYYFAERTGLANALTRFWGPDAIENRLRLLAQEPAFEDASTEERRLLTEARTDLLTDDDILVDIRRMHALVGDRLVLVTPAVDEAAPEPLRKSNAELVAALKVAGGQLGLPVYDPTPAVAEFRAEHGFGSSTADTQLFNATFESYLAGILQRDFLMPLRRAGTMREQAAPQASVAEAAARENVLDAARRRLVARLPRRGIGWLPVAWPPGSTRPVSWLRVPWPTRTARAGAVPAVAEPAPLPSAPLPSAPDPWEAAIVEARKAAWYGEWSAVAAWAEGFTDRIARDPVFCERAATALWYAGDKGAALALWKIRLADPVAPLRMVEAAELAFQTGDSDQAASWCLAAAERDPLAAIAAIRLLDAHGRHDRVEPLLDRISATPGLLPALAAQLQAGGQLRTMVVEYGLSRGYLDPDSPLARQVIQQWQAALMLDFREGRLDAVRAGAARFDGFNPDHPIRQSVRQVLARALTGRLRDADMGRNTEQAEALAREILSIDPAHVEASITLSRMLDLRGDRSQASDLLEVLSLAHPKAVAVQFAAISQWLSWGEVVPATAAYRRCQDNQVTDDMLAELRKRLAARIEREERQARKLNDRERMEEMRRCMDALGGTPEVLPAARQAAS